MMDYDSTTANQVSQYLDAVDFPADQSEIVSQISSLDPPAGVIDLIQQLPSRRYESQQEAANYFDSIAVDNLITTDEDED